MSRILLGALLGAVVYYVWISVSWLVLPLHNATIHDLPNEAGVVEVLKEGKVESGAYYFPAMPKTSDPKTSEVWISKHRAGPYGVVFYSAEGGDPMTGATFGRGFLLDFVAALLACGLLWYAAPGLRYTSRLIFITAMGLFAVAVTHLPLWNWMHYPFDYQLVMCCDVVVGWFLAGLVIAAVVQPRAKPQAAA